MAYCRSCAKEVSDQAVVCTACGAPPRAGTRVCWHCAAPTEPMTQTCVKCGVSQSSAGVPTEAKSKIVAGLLGIFLGWAGIHRFYLGYTAIGVAQLVLSVALALISCGTLGWIAGLWGFVEGILILVGSTITKDAKGVPLKD